MKTCLLTLVGAILLVGCSQEQTYQPEEINPEIDVCEICNMSIAHENFATELISTDREVYKFDDLGCMTEFVQQEELITKDEIAKQYVRDMNSGKWIELEQASHVYHPDFWTPMANGVVTFENKEDAEKYIQDQGKGELYDYEKLLSHSWSWAQ